MKSTVTRFSDAAGSKEHEQRRAGDRRPGGEVVVDQLSLLGVTTLFGVPGESYLPVLEALRTRCDRVRYVTTRHEGAAAFMADAIGKLTGRPGVCIVSRGPGALHAANGVHMAAQDSTPMLLLVGGISTSVREREAFQEIDVHGVFAPLAKWAADVGHVDRLPELVSRAVATTTSGRPGPVVLGLPEDVLLDETDAPLVEAFERGTSMPDGAALKRVRQLLSSAERPILLVGGAGWTAEAAASIERFSRVNGIAVATIFRFQDAVDNELETYVGDLGIGANPKLLQHINECDLIVAIGPRLGDATTAGYRRLSVPRPHQALVHVHQSSDEIGRVYRPTLGLSCSLEGFASELANLSPLERQPWRSWVARGRESYLEWRTAPNSPSGTRAPSKRGDVGSAQSSVDLGGVFSMLRSVLPDDAIVTNGAGNYTTWIHRFLSFRQFRTQLAPTGGSMGYGLPAALAAKIAHPEREVVCVAGDGCFLMTGQELATAVQEQLAVVILVVNNRMYGTIRMHQERSFPGRPFATELITPNFAMLARSYGAYGEIVTTTTEFPGAFDRARSCGLPAVLELQTDPLRLSPSMHLGEYDHGSFSRSTS